MYAKYIQSEELNTGALLRFKNSKYASLETQVKVIIDNIINSKLLILKVEGESSTEN